MKPEYLDTGSPRILWYPSIGNKGNPYSISNVKGDLALYDTLEFVGQIYHNQYRTLRMAYKWTPEAVDNMDLWRIIKIYEECLEEIESRKQKPWIDPDDIEGNF